MLNKTYKIILLFTISLLIINSNFISSISSKSETDKNSIENNNFLADNSLLAYWSLDEGSGIIAHDYSGHGLDGIIHGTTWTNGYSEYALNFDGDLDYILLDDHINELGFNKTDDYKISAWIKTASNTTGTIYMLSELWTVIPIFYLKILANGTIEMKVSSSETCDVTVNSETSYNDNIWHFIEGIYRGTDSYPTIDLYIDNELVASKTDWLCDLVSTDFKRAKIGMASYDSIDMYNGLIDEIKIFKRPEGNQPPNPPVISGPTSGTIYEVYNYTFSISDTENDELYLWVDWGDNTNTGWLGPFNSYQNIILNHSWVEINAYEIKAKLRDTFDIGEWGTLIVAMGNIAPTKPTIEGPITGSKGIDLEYSFTSKDLNGHDIKYHIDWGDEVLTEWTDFYPSGETVVVKHKYNHQGTYSIKANAIDIYGKESNWSKSFIVNITENALLMGIITNRIYDNDFIYFNAKLLVYMGLKPIKANFYLNKGKFLITYDYVGNITENFIYGVFNTAIIY